MLFSAFTQHSLTPDLPTYAKINRKRTGTGDTDQIGLRLAKAFGGYRSLVFLHIPRTAGTTLSRIIERQYSPRSVVRVEAQPGPHVFADLFGLSKVQKSQIRCVIGHVPFGVHVHLLAPYCYVTLLRDPADRIISHYYYVLNQPYHPFHDQVVSGRMTLLDYVTSGISTELENDQTRLIAGHDPGSASEMLQIAKENLREHFAVVGLSERFDESLVLMRKRFGWRNVCYVRQNGTPDRPAKSALPNDVVSQIAQMNSVDTELYAYAQKLLEESISAEGPQFQEDVNRFRATNRVLGRLAQWDPVGILARVFRRYGWRIGGL